VIIYVDIDETICRYDGPREYPSAIPIREHINKINKLYDEGNTIVYWTARGSKTKIDWTDLTKKTTYRMGCQTPRGAIGETSL